jgi:alkylhydroperoxidase/carboxymuconolactone decarboxylase family protein YurZ
MISNMQYPREMYGKGGLTSLKEARNLLEKYALPGESLAYINDEESKFLKYMGGAGIPVNSSGVPSYFKPKRIFKSITKPVAKVLDKIVPNEIKPFLPYVAAAIPFIGPAMSATLAGLSATQLAAVSAGANAFSQLSQEGAAERGLNPISLGLSALSGYTAGAGLQAPGTATAGNIAGNVGDMAVKTSDLASQGYSTIRGIDDLSQLGFAPSLSAGQGLSLTPPNLTQQLSNLGGSTTEFLGKVSRPGMESIDRIATDPFAAKGADYLSAAQTLAPGQVAAAGEVAYNAALDAQKAYQNELLAMGNLASANKQDQINYIRRAMVSAGFNENEISSAISRSGFAGGGRVAYGMGSLVKPAMRGLKSMKNKIVDFISKMTDDIEIRTQTDYADDSGASFDIYITPKTERGKNTLDQINQMGLAEKISDGRYFINDINLEEATMSLNERGIKASGVYEPTAKGEQFESFRTAGQGPYGADYYGYDRLKEGLQGPKRPPMDQVDYDTIPSPTDKPEGFADGGLMNLRMGGMPAEMDLRKGGFVPLGVKEKADDVPARLSKNEFVFTAKAVRNAGGGDVRKGAKRMYQVMNQLEARA